MDEIKKDLYLFFSNLKKLNIKKSKLSIIFITMIASNCIHLINPLLFGKLIDAIVNKSSDDIKQNILFMVILFIISIIFSYINSSTLIKVTTKLEIDAKTTVFNSILRLPYNEFNKINKGTLINNVENDSTVFSGLLSNNINIIIDIISMIISFILMVFVNPYLTITLLISLPIIGGIYLLSGKKIKLKEIEYQDKNDSYIRFLNESIYGLKFLKVFNAENSRNITFKNTITNLYSIEVKKILIQMWSGISINSITFIANMISTILGIYLIFKGDFSLGMLTAFNSYADIFKSSSLALAQLSSIIQQTCVSLLRIENIINRSIEDISYIDDNILSEKIQSIKVSDLSYSIFNENNIFKKTTIEFRKNRIYVIKGDSGSGKTTLFNILSKFINSYDGDVLINDIPLREINTNSIRQKISYITQDNYLFSESIFDNIALYRDINLEKVINTCKSLNLHNKIISLPDKYNTIVNTNGTDLSGGERQRVCIARSIIDNPDVYLFDEITSAVDKKNTSDIIDIIENISKDSIVIINTHDDLEFSYPVFEYHLKDSQFNLVEVQNI